MDQSLAPAYQTIQTVPGAPDATVSLPVKAWSGSMGRQIQAAVLLSIHHARAAVTAADRLTSCAQSACLAAVAGNRAGANWVPHDLGQAALNRYTLVESDLPAGFHAC